MFDNIDFILTKDNAKGIDLLAEIPQRLTNVSEHSFNNGNNIALTGYLDNLKVSVTDKKLKIKDSSICKYYLGDNLQTLTRADVKRAIEKISDTLNIPLNNANITRADVGTNNIMKNEISVYTNHLGILQYHNRLEQSKGLYYNNSNNQLIFYDKISEYKTKGGIVPEIYKNRHLLRYEIRYKNRLPQQFNKPEIKAKLLYDEEFYINIIDRWHNEYKKINKIRNSISFDYSMIKTVKLYQLQAILFYVLNNKGGELEALIEISEAQKRGDLTKKQAHDLREQIKAACKNKLLTCESDVITELDNKINQSVKFYR